MAIKKSNEEIKEAVKEHYGTAITQKTGSCCSPTPVNFDQESAGRFVKISGYTDAELKGMPENVTSFGCGNPVNFIDVKEGETVLDLGSGAGLDLILAAKKVGESGRVIGLDMTDEMISVCKRNMEEAGIKNGEVLKGEMEQMPVDDNQVDWIISNCVINLSPEKEKVFSEAFRVLKPGGQVMVSDIVTVNLPDEYRDDIKAWVGCIGGAVDENDYKALMKQAGFSDIKVVDKMMYDAQSLSTLANDACGCGDSDRSNSVDSTTLDKFAGKVATVKFSAMKPA